MTASIEKILTHGHEYVGIHHDTEASMTMMIAVHNTVLGPSLGGCRMRKYATLDDALLDVLRLSEGMTHKNSLAGLRLGGGKAVIAVHGQSRFPREEIFRRFGKHVASLGGSYITAEDMGVGVDDIETVKSVCPYVAGRDRSNGGGGDPSPYTALGVISGMKACLERAYGTQSFQDRTVAIQGVGKVGTYVATYLAEAGAKLFVADTLESNVARVCRDLGASAVSHEAIKELPCDIFSPCAVGAVINPATAPKFSCRIIAGGANNQLSNEEVESELQRRGILYAPDFAINAGGVIMCADELEPDGFKDARVKDRARNIYNTVGKILDEARMSGELAQKVAIRLAMERIDRERIARTARDAGASS